MEKVGRKSVFSHKRAGGAKRRFLQKQANLSSKIPDAVWDEIRLQ